MIKDWIDFLLFWVKNLQFWIEEYRKFDDTEGIQPLVSEPRIGTRRVYGIHYLSSKSKVTRTTRIVPSKGKNA